MCESSAIEEADREKGDNDTLRHIWSVLIQHTQRIVCGCCGSHCSVEDGQGEEGKQHKGPVQREESEGEEDDRPCEGSSPPLLSWMMCCIGTI